MPGFGERSFRQTKARMRELSRCPVCTLPKLALNAGVHGFTAEKHCTCPAPTVVPKRLGKIKDVVGIIEQRLKGRPVLDVVPRTEARLFPNQILLESRDGEYLVSVIKTRVSRRT